MAKNVSKLWKTEDWLAVWIGFIVIAIGMVAVLTKAFDFSALTFKTWTWGEGLTDAQMAKVVPLGQQFAAGAYYYADIPEYEKVLDWDTYQARLPYWVYVVLFLAWGALMFWLWKRIDR